MDGQVIGLVDLRPTETLSTDTLTYDFCLCVCCKTRICFIGFSNQYYRYQFWPLLSRHKEGKRGAQWQNDLHAETLHSLDLILIRFISS